MRSGPRALCDAPGGGGRSDPTSWGRAEHGRHLLPASLLGHAPRAPTGASTPARVGSYDQLVLEATFLVLLIAASLAIVWFAVLVLWRLFRGQS